MANADTTGILDGMNSMATIKVTQSVRDELREAANAARLTQGQLIAKLLADRRKAQFWTKLEAETPDQNYLDELDEADTALMAEAENAIARFEDAE